MTRRTDKNTMTDQTEEDEIYNHYLEKALSGIQNNNYRKAAENLEKAGEETLQAEAERLEGLLGNHSELIGGNLGAVVGNYTDRIIDDLARKLHGEDKEEN